MNPINCPTNMKQSSTPYWKNWNLKTQTKMEANGLNSSTWKKSRYPALACTKCQLNVFVMSPRQLRDQRRTSKQKGSAPSRVPKWIAVMGDTTARTQMKLPPNAQLLPAESNSWYPTENMVDGNLSDIRWAYVGCAGRPTESMADGNPTKW